MRYLGGPVVDQRCVLFFPCCSSLVPPRCFDLDLASLYIYIPGQLHQQKSTRTQHRQKRTKVQRAQPSTSHHITSHNFTMQYTAAHDSEVNEQSDKVRKVAQCALVHLVHHRLTQDPVVRYVRALVDTHLKLLQTTTNRLTTGAQRTQQSPSAPSRKLL